MADTVSPWPLVRQGNFEHPVTTLQYLLRARNHPVAPDGIFGPKTDDAVRDFQREKHLTVDGIVGPQTWQALIITVRRGSTGDAVRAVQGELQFRDLSDDGPLEPVIDGDFGPDIERRIRGFQSGVHASVPALAVDGIVGPMTWQALVSGMLSF